MWNETDSRQASNHLSDKINEPKQLIVYSKAPVRVTVNLEAEQLSQGQVGVVHEVPTGDSVTIYVPDSSGGEVDITPGMLEREEYLTWRLADCDSLKADRLRSAFQELSAKGTVTAHELCCHDNAQTHG